MLKEWINPKYLSGKKFKSKFLKAKPYPHLQLNDFLKKNKAKTLLKEVMQAEFFEKESDLFKFKQTNDFATADNLFLKQFRDFMASREMVNLMEELTGEQLKVGVVDCGASLYQDTDFLLPHDDQLEGRSVAYILYLENLSKKEGGSLALYSSKKGRPDKVIKQLRPKFNSLAFFKVSTTSFHQVEEVTANKDRASVNGWFHGK